MKKRIIVISCAIVLVWVLAIGWSLVRIKMQDNPVHFAQLPIPEQGRADWVLYQSSRHGYTLRYPQEYLLTEGTSGIIGLKQNGAAAEDPRAIGKQVALIIYGLPSRTTLRAGGRKVDLRNASSLDELEQQLTEAEKTTTGEGYFVRRRFDGCEALVCVLREAGESALMTGGIYEVYIIGEFETEGDERVLAVMSNNGGGTPHTGDRSLRRDMLYIFNTLHWE